MHMVRSSWFSDWATTPLYEGWRQVAPRKKLWKRSTAEQVREKLPVEVVGAGVARGRRRAREARRRGRERMFVFFFLGFSVAGFFFFGGWLEVVRVAELRR
jgi:hypothetical protein